MLPLLRNARPVKTKRTKREETVHLLRLYSNFRGDLAFAVWDNLAVSVRTIVNGYGTGGTEAGKVRTQI